MKKAVKITAIVAAVLLAGLLVFFLWQEKKVEKEKETLFVEMEKEMRPLDLQKRKLRQELDDLEKAYTKASQGMASLVLLFTDMDEIIYTEIYSKMKEYGFIGMLTLSENQVPGQAGCVSKQQFEELIEAGWKCCLRWEKDMDTSEWLLSARKVVSETGIPQPETVYFPQGTYDSRIDNFLKRQGFTIAVHHGEEDLPLTVLESGEGIWQPGAFGWNQNGVSPLLSDAVSQRGNLVFTIGSDSQSEEYLGEDFSAMLRTVGKYCDSNELMVTDLITAREYRRNLEGSQEGLAQDFEENKAELEEQIEEVDRAIDSVTKKYVREQE